ncbi:MAG: hypothetical protein P1P87_13525, partial [Trueperaceae bacterium]|nr:hypothetical protein [Trueperaceae bacterium]
VALVCQHAGWATVPVAAANADGTFQISNGDAGDFARWAAAPGVHMVAADFNGDGRVDSDDLTRWQNDFGAGAAGDADQDGDVDGAVASFA